MSANPQGGIVHYHYTITPPAKTIAEEQWVLQQIWPMLTKNLETFVVRAPHHIFSPMMTPSDLETKTPANSELSYPAHDISIRVWQKWNPDQINSGQIGEAEVVAKHIVKKLASATMYQKVGRRWFNSNDVMEGKSQMTIFSGFHAALSSLNSHGPQLQIDMVYRALHKRNIIDLIGSSLEADAMNLDDPDVKAEWRRRCLHATVVTLYNNRIYRVKAIHFDMTPQSKFMMYVRDEKKKKEMTFSEYYQAYYNKSIQEQRQPVLEVYAEKDKEKVFLMPEHCALTGFNEEMRKDKNLMAEALKQTKVSPQERLNAILNLTADMAGGKLGEASGQNSAAKHCSDWGFSVDKTPLELEARIFDPLDVSFGSKRYVIEEGNFQRWMRNGLQCPTRLDDWIFIYPETDVPVLDIWLRSLRDIAQVAFTMKMADPTRIICSDQRAEIVQLLENRLTAKTQMVLLLTPQKDSKKVYQLFKQTTVSKYPCVTQVVKSETIRKRQSIAAVLSRIVLQINAKFCGPLWHIDLEAPVTKPFFQGPTMVVGIDVYFSPEGEAFVGFAASLDTHCTEYFSTATALDTKDGNIHKSLSLKIQAALRDSLVNFTKRNEGLLPEHILVYRASVQEEEWAKIRATEVEAIMAVTKAVTIQGKGAAYEPNFTFVGIAKRVAMRFFAPSPNQHNIKNPEPGTVIDSPLVCRSNCHNFFLINQAVGKGTATPTHYFVLYDNASVPANALQNLSYRLSFLYFNYTGSVKMPAPAQYAKKVAHLIGTAVKTDPHKRLLRTFFYL